tara:strand:+ start:252 stop:413 length:162 start_codon:yes stop_codon:yes gene_type:complete
MKELIIVAIVCVMFKALPVFTGTVVSILLILAWMPIKIYTVKRKPKKYLPPKV